MQNSTTFVFNVTSLIVSSTTQSSSVLTPTPSSTISGQITSTPSTITSGQMNITPSTITSGQMNITPSSIISDQITSTPSTIISGQMNSTPSSIFSGQMTSTPSSITSGQMTSTPSSINSNQMTTHGSSVATEPLSTLAQNSSHVTLYPGTVTPPTSPSTTLMPGLSNSTSPGTLQQYSSIITSNFNESMQTTQRLSPSDNITVLSSSATSTSFPVELTSSMSSGSSTLHTPSSSVLSTPYLAPSFSNITATETSYYKSLTSVFWNVTEVTPYESSTAVTESGNTTDVTGSWNSTDVTESGNTTDVTGSWNSTDVTGIWNSTDDTESGNTTDVTGSWNSTDVTGSWNSTDDTESWNSTDVTGSWNSTDDTESGNTTDVTGSWNSTDVTESWNSTDVTESGNTTEAANTTTSLTTFKTSTIRTTITTTARTSSRATTITSTTEVPIEENALTVPVIIGITVGLVVLTALIFIMLLWRRKAKQDHSVNIPKRYSVNSTKSSFKNQSFYGRHTGEHHPHFAPVYYGEAEETDDRKPVRMSSYKIKDTNTQVGETFDEVKLRSREPLSRVDELKLESAEERHSFPYEKRRLRFYSQYGKDPKNFNHAEALKRMTNGDLNKHGENGTSDKPSNIKMNGVHDNTSEPNGTPKTPLSIADTKL